MPRRNSSLGANPLDAILPGGSPQPAATTSAPVLRPVSVSVGLRPDLLERARNAVYWTPGLTLAGVANLGLSLALDQLERVNDGKPFPPRAGAVPVGRRVQPAAQDRTQPPPVW